MSRKRCLECYYFRFVALERWCGHPDRDKRITDPTSYCKNWIWTEDKTTTKPMKVNINHSLNRYYNPCGSTCAIIDDKKAIKCLICNYISYHPDDVKQKYCSMCKRFHEE